MQDLQADPIRRFAVGRGGPLGRGRRRYDVSLDDLGPVRHLVEPADDACGRGPVLADAIDNVEGALLQRDAPGPIAAEVDDRERERGHDEGQSQPTQDAQQAPHARR